MQGIAALPEAMGQAQPGSPINTQEAALLGRLLSKISGDEISKLRELVDELKTFSEPELKDFLGGVDYLMQNANNYKQSVRNLVMRGIVEPGDLPPEYIPTFFSILRQMIVSALESVQQTAKFAKGGLVAMADKVRKAGRDGDTMLAHITPMEAKALKSMGGAGTINPATGLPEFKSFWSKVGGFLKSAAPVLLPVALNFVLPGIGGAVGGALGMSAAAGSALVGAVGAGVGGLIAGQKPGQALVSALLGGVGSYAMSSLAPEGLPGIFGGGSTGGAEAAGVSPEGAAPSYGGVRPDIPIPNSRAVMEATGSPATLGGAPYANSPAVAAAYAPGGAPTAGVSGGLGNLFDTATSWVKEHPYMTAGALGLGAMMFADQQKGQGAGAGVPAGPTGPQLLARNPGKYGFDVANFTPQTTPQVIVAPGTSPAFPGGYSGQMPRYYAAAGGHVSGPGTGTSDDVPAMLSDGEFVITAKAVRGAGDGSRIKGAKRLYKLMNQLEKRA